MPRLVEYLKKIKKNNVVSFCLVLGSPKINMVATATPVGHFLLLQKHSRSVEGFKASHIRPNFHSAAPTVPVLDGTAAIDCVFIFCL